MGTGSSKLSDWPNRLKFLRPRRAKVVRTWALSVCHMCPCCSVVLGKHLTPACSCACLWQPFPILLFSYRPGFAAETRPSAFWPCPAPASVPEFLTAVPERPGAASHEQKTVPLL